MLDLREKVLLHEPIRPGRRWGAVALLCALAGGCAPVAVPPLAPIPPAQAALDSVGASSASRPLPPALPPPEVAHMKLPPWLTLETVHGTTHDIHHRSMADAAFTSDGRSLVTLASDGGLRVWDLVARVLRAEVGACDVTGASKTGAGADPFPPAARVAEAAVAIDRREARAGGQQRRRLRARLFVCLPLMKAGDARNDFAEPLLVHHLHETAPGRRVHLILSITCFFHQLCRGISKVQRDW